MLEWISTTDEKPKADTPIVFTVKYKQLLAVGEEIRHTYLIGEYDGEFDVFCSKVSFSFGGDYEDIDCSDVPCWAYINTPEELTNVGAIV